MKLRKSIGFVVVLCWLMGGPGEILIGMPPQQQFTSEEDKQLIELVGIYGTNWKIIASKMPGHKPKQCKSRWTYYLAPDANFCEIKRYFTPREDAALRALVEKYEPCNWKIIASQMPNRDAKQCRDRWLNYLRPGINRDLFSPEEDELLISLFKEYGSKWSFFAKEYFPNRTDMDLKNRHNQLKHATFLISPHEGIQPKEDQSPKQSNHLEQKSVESLIWGLPSDEDFYLFQSEKFYQEFFNKD
ncbi:MAG: hypothetical protein LBG98_03965 [Puniceicoccales bacterium]|jgi:hypothetical protein|nr:hypothetical protein [Puniceicoccales bacterium]